MLFDAQKIQLPFITIIIILLTLILLNSETQIYQHHTAKNLNRENVKLQSLPYVVQHNPEQSYSTIHVTLKKKKS